MNSKIPINTPKKPSCPSSPCQYTFSDCLLPLCNFLISLSMAIIAIIANSKLDMYRNEFAVFAAIVTSLQMLFSLKYLIFVKKNTYVPGPFFKKLVIFLTYVFLYVSVPLIIYAMFNGCPDSNQIIVFLLTYTNLVTSGIDIFNRKNCAGFYSDYMIAIFFLSIVGFITFSFSNALTNIIFAFVQFISALPIPLSFFFGTAAMSTLGADAIKILVIINLAFVITYYINLRELSNCFSFLTTVLKEGKAPVIKN
ncbi:hypothetical protein TUBRATIS_15520 [Tubulinosema ratisbonensis]|uniref:Uncharacterized protein n=1 Tax=Tubulinosema ratisbonensis TaxID=291195 RepID=A0A437ALA7_9MICR|nr:hypothetical protein TUBRATIS_15520 [Tubulinosema ratisbonensis]